MRLLKDLEWLGEEIYSTVNPCVVTAKPAAAVKDFWKMELYYNSLNVEFFVKRIKAQADLQFVKIFGDWIN